jgi:Na+/H+ antiporter NhaD/arsenite permease-like protein
MLQSKYRYCCLYFASLHFCELHRITSLFFLSNCVHLLLAFLRYRRYSWRSAWRDNDDTVEWRIFGFLVFFVGLHITMLSLKKAGALSDVLASRPTLVANQLHCTSVMCLRLFEFASTIIISFLLWTTLSQLCFAP